MRASTTKRVPVLTAVATIALSLLALPGPAAADTRHRVRPGETLIQIAARYGASVRVIASANGIVNTNTIIVGQTLVVPTGSSGSGSASTSRPSGGVHVVIAGETLIGVARRYGTTSSAIASANGIANQNLLAIGRRLTIPGTAAPAAPPAATPAVTAAGGVHTVVRGETVVGIARRYGVSVSSIVSANRLANSNLLMIGQRLTIPSAADGGTTGAGGTSGYARTGGATGRTGVPGTHTVSSNETLERIASRYGVSAADLAAANGLLPPYRLYASTQLALSAPNRLPTNIARCPVPGATFVNDWAFPRSGGRFHAGNDLLAPTGTPIVAPVSGTVSQFSGAIGGLQFRLRGDDRTSYIGTHLSAYAKAGRVAAGEVIGYVGASGNAAGGPSHLHFEIHPDNGPAMNPFPVLREACG